MTAAVSNPRTMRPLIPAKPDERREYEPTFTLGRQVKEARRSMTPERWQELNAEWPA